VKKLIRSFLVLSVAVLAAGLWLPRSSFGAIVHSRVAGDGFFGGEDSAIGEYSASVNALTGEYLYTYPDVPEVFYDLRATTGGSATGNAGGDTWLLRNYAAASSDTYVSSLIGAQASTTSSWTDTVTVTASSQGRVTLRFHFSSSGYLAVATDDEDQIALARGSHGLATLADNGSGGIFQSSYHVQLGESVHTTDVGGRVVTSTYENTYEGPGLIGGYFEGSGYYEVGVALNQQNANGLWYGSSNYWISTTSEAVAAQGTASVDWGHTVLLTSVSLGDSGATPESLGYALSFESGLLSPNVDTAAVPEPASLVIWSLGALGCAITAYRRRNQAA
jgi:hypothetical protein